MSNEWYVRLYIRTALFFIKKRGFSNSSAYWTGRLAHCLFGQEGAVKVGEFFADEVRQYFVRQWIDNFKLQIEFCRSFVEYREVRRLSTDDVTFIESLIAESQKAIDFLQTDKEHDMWQEHAVIDNAKRALDEFSEWHQKKFSS